MTTLTHQQIRSGEALERFESLDEGLRAWAISHGAEEYHFPVLIAGGALRLAEYPDAFPHLLMAPCVAADPEKTFAGHNVELCDWFLSPAVCYHSYAAFAGRALETNQMLTARGCCFRHEDPTALAPGRRQIEFEMREVILIGEPEWIEERLAALQPDVTALAVEAGLQGDWQPANDPFFLPRARGKAHMQRLLGTKIEYCLDDGLAVASINRHGAFFGERFFIRNISGGISHSACIAFGLDRWAAHHFLATLNHASSL